MILHPWKNIKQNITCPNHKKSSFRALHQHPKIYLFYFTSISTHNLINRRSTHVDWFFILMSTTFILNFLTFKLLYNICFLRYINHWYYFSMHWIFKEMSSKSRVSWSTQTHKWTCLFALYYVTTKEFGFKLSKIKTSWLSLSKAVKATVSQHWYLIDENRINLKK